MKVVMLACTCGVALAMTLRAEDTRGLLRNGSFAAVGNDGRPIGWRVYAEGQGVSVDTNDLPKAVSGSVRVDVKTAASGQGSVCQTVKDFPRGATMALKGSTKGSAAGVGWMQVKLKRQGKELRRWRSAGNALAWEEREIKFVADDADELTVECRFSQSAEAKGQSVWFAGLSLTVAAVPVGNAVSGRPEL